MHLLPVYMYTVHVCLMLHMYNEQCVCSRILLTVYHHNGIKISYFIFYQIEFSRKFPLTGVIQLLSKCSVFSFSGGKTAPTQESKIIYNIMVITHSF